MTRAHEDYRVCFVIPNIIKCLGVTRLCGQALISLFKYINIYIDICLLCPISPLKT